MSSETERSELQLRELVRSLPKPVLIQDDEILSEPWNATDNQFPAFVTVEYVRRKTREHKVGEHPFAEYIQRRHFGAILFGTWDATASGWQPAAGID